MCGRPAGHRHRGAGGGCRSVVGMEYTHLGRSGVSVSRLCLGTMNFGPLTPAAEADAIMDHAHEIGINFFDTANRYGGAQSPPGQLAQLGESHAGWTEEIIGDWFASGVGRRERTVLATKLYGAMGDWPNEGKLSALNIRRACEASLRRLRTDYIDLYQLHTPDPLTPIEETIAALDELVAEGKVRYIGHSNLSGWQLADAAHKSAARTPFISAQNHWSMVDRGVEAEVVPAAVAFGLGVLPYFPLANGMLTGKVRRGSELPAGSRIATRSHLVTDEKLDTVEALIEWGAERGVSILEIAIGGLAAQPGCASVIAGATSAEQVVANVAAGEWEPAQEELAELDKISPPPAREF